MQPVDLLEIEDDLITAEICSRSYFEFFKEFWSEVVGDELILNWHIEYICNELQLVAERVFEQRDENGTITKRRQPKAYDLIINVPPGTSKSTICTILFPAWCWVRDASLRIISGSHDAGLATEHAVKTRDVLKSDKFRRIYGHLFDFKGDQNNKTHYANTRKGSRIATSVGGKITGKHAHILLVDDPIDPKSATSEVKLNVANEWMGKTLSSRKVNKKVTPTILIMQRLHEDDPTGTALKKKADKVKHICLPAEEADNISPPELRDNYVDGLLDPVRLDQEVLDEMKTDLGSYGYAGQAQQNPAPAEGGIIKKHWFRKIHYHEFLNIVPAPSRVVNFFLDTSYTEQKKNNDPSAFMATCYYQHNLYILMSASQWLEFPDLVKETMSFVLQNGYDNKSRVLIEPKASGKSVVQSFKNSTFNVIELPPPLDDKVTRTINSTPTLEAGRVYIIIGAWNDQFIGECAAFPTASHDDQVDNLNNAITYYTTKPAVQRTHGSQRI